MTCSDGPTSTMRSPSMTTAPSTIMEWASSIGRTKACVMAIRFVMGCWARLGSGGFGFGLRNGCCHGIQDVELRDVIQSVDELGILAQRGAPGMAFG